jgi:UDP-N-acetylglucosamine 2-epimerase (non-hydrolysing)
MTSPRITVLSTPPGSWREAAPGAWQRGAVAQRDGAALVHVSTSAEDVPRIAGVLLALEEVGAFDQVVLDASPEADASTALTELGVAVPVRHVGPAHAGLAERLQTDLADARCTALVLHADGPVALAAAVAATRTGASVVRVGSVAAHGRPGAARAVGRLADLLLVPEESDVLAAHDVAERIRVVGNPLIDVVRRFSRAAVARAGWRDEGVEPGAYVLAILTGRPDEAVLEPLVALAAEVPLVLDGTARWRRALAEAGVAGRGAVSHRGFVDRLSLERAAGAIVTDSLRAQEEAAALGIRCYALGEPRGRVRADASGTTVGLARDPDALLAVRPDPNPPTPSVIPLWDGRAGARIADVLVANFARLRLA